jgi:hypothetical protein
VDGNNARHGNVILFMKNLSLLILLMFAGALPFQAKAGGFVCEASFKEITYLGGDRFLLSVVPRSDCLAKHPTLVGKGPVVKILVRYLKAGILEHAKNRTNVTEADFKSGVNRFLVWAEGEDIALGLMGQGLAPTDSPGEYDAVSNALKIQDGVVYSFD